MNLDWRAGGSDGEEIFSLRPVFRIVANEERLEVEERPVCFDSELPD
jgi:hypothetical protein